MVNEIKEMRLKTLSGYTITFGNSKMKIISDFGCNLIELILDGKEVLDTNKDFDNLTLNKGAKSALLIPFPNRISKGKYTFENKEHQIEINKPEEENAIHGVLYNKPFKLTKKNITEQAASITFEHEIKKEDIKGYPFHILVSITFILEKTRLSIIINTTNKGNNNAPYGVGWHPYFKITRKLEDCAIMIPSNTILELDDKKPMIPTGEVLKNKHLPTFDLIGDAEFDTCFTNLTQTECFLEEYTIFFDKSMDFLQIYTPKDRSSIAIEPMSCAPDAFNNKMGLDIIKPNETKPNFFGIKIEKK
ncbi:MAG: aldose 1-epimerase [Candidatus Woesearchaeota archaeon]